MAKKDKEKQVEKEKSSVASKSGSKSEKPVEEGKEKVKKKVTEEGQEKVKKEVAGEVREKVKRRSAKKDAGAEGEVKDNVDVVNEDAKGEKSGSVKEELEASLKELKDAFGELKKQLAPLGESLKEVMQEVSVKVGGTEIKSGGEVEKAQEDEGGDVVSLEAERLKRRGMTRSIDLKEVFKHQVSQYLEEHVKDDSFSVNEEGKKVVKIDSEFLAQHGKSLVPSLFGGIAQALFGPLVGSKSEEPVKEGDSESKETASEKEEGYRFEFDFTNMMAGFLEKGKVVKEAESVEEEEEQARAKETLMTVARRLDEQISGEKKEEVVVEEVEVEKKVQVKKDKANEEKQKKISEISKKFDESVSGKSAKKEGGKGSAKKGKSTDKKDKE